MWGRDVNSINNTSAHSFSEFPEGRQEGWGRAGRDSEVGTGVASGKLERKRGPSALLKEGPHETRLVLRPHASSPYVTGFFFFFLLHPMFTETHFIALNMVPTSLFVIPLSEAEVT